MRWDCGSFLGGISLGLGVTLPLCFVGRTVCLVSCWDSSWNWIDEKKKIYLFFHLCIV